jgi:hypothetical protein
MLMPQSTDCSVTNLVSKSNSWSHRSVAEQTPANQMLLVLTAKCIPAAHNHCSAVDTARIMHYDVCNDKQKLGYAEQSTSESTAGQQKQQLAVELCW